MVLGEGNWVSAIPCARNASPAALAVSRIYASVVRNVGSCWACASANSRRAAAASGYTWATIIRTQSRATQRFRRKTARGEWVWPVKQVADGPRENTDKSSNNHIFSIMALWKVISLAKRRLREQPTLSSIRVMATQVEKNSGERTMARRASRLRRKRPRGVMLKHRAAVLPAKNQVMKIIPAKAEDE